MKALLVGLLLLRVAVAGEISDVYYNAAKERGAATAKQREEAEKQVDTQLRAAHPDLHLLMPPTGGFVFLTNNGITEIAHVSTNHGVSEFGLERRGFSFIVTSDGKCRYTGRSLKFPAPPVVAAQVTQKTGFVSMVEFHRIADFLVEIDYWDLKDDYDASATDFPTVFSTAVRNGKRKTIRNFADAGPSRLWALEHLIDAMIAHVRWDAKP
jgi:hypothetical protein